MIFVVIHFSGNDNKSHENEWYKNTTNSTDIETSAQKNELMYYENCSDLYFIGNTDKPPLSYDVNEEMKFTVSLYSGDSPVFAPYFWYEITADDGKTNTGFTENTSETAVINTSCSVPGFVFLKVYPCNENKEIITGQNITIFRGGACAGFADIEKAKDEPSDFDTFWSKQLSLLDYIPAKASVSRLYENHDFDDYEVYDVSIPCIDDSNPVSGYITIPKNAKDGSLKIRVIYMGYDVTSAIIVPEPGYITFAINPHGIDNGMYPLYYDLLERDELSLFGFYGNENPEESYFRNMILRDILGIRYIKQAYANLWNGKDLEVKGGSMGAFQASAVAALMQDDITKVILEIPWLCDLGSETEGRLNGWRPEYCIGLGYYDTVSFGRRITAPTEVIAGLGDYICPPSGVAVLFNNLSCEKTITFIQNMTHDYTPEKQISYSKNVEALSK